MAGMLKPSPRPASQAVLQAQVEASRPRYDQLLRDVERHRNGSYQKFATYTAASVLA